MTASRRGNPICGAAKPTPGPAYIVSRICAMSWRISSLAISAALRVRAFWRSPVSPTCKISTDTLPATHRHRPLAASMGAAIHALRPLAPRGRRGGFLLDWRAHQVSPLGPRAIVILHAIVAQQVRQHEPGMRTALPDAAVGDHFVGVPKPL